LQQAFVHNPGLWYLPSARRCNNIRPSRSKIKTLKALCKRAFRWASIFSIAPSGVSTSSTRITSSFGIGVRLEPLDLIFQQLAGKVDAAFDRTQGLLKHLGYLVVFKAIEIKQERITEYLRQLMNGCLYILYPKITFDSTRHCHLSRIEQKLVGRAVKNGILFGFTAVVINENIPHDRVKPGLDIRADVVLILIG